MGKYVVALDQGTTSTRCIIFDKQGNICGKAQKEIAQSFPQPGWVEQNPLEIWSSSLAVMMEAAATFGIKHVDVAGIGITNQRETTIVWDKNTGEPVYPAIVWQCRRTAPMIDRLKKEGFDKVVRERTGLIPDAYFSASKIAWILQNVDGVAERARRGELLFGTVETWLIWNMSGGLVHVTDYTNASRTMLFDIHNLCWDKEILDWFGIPECMLPDVKPSSCIYGYTDENAIPGRVPISGAAGDQQSALFGQRCFDAGDVKNTYGTGCFLLMNTGEEAVASKHGLLTTIIASADEKVRYALEGSVFIGGAAVQWLRDGMRLVEHSAETEEFAKRVPDTGGVYLVPAFAGMGAPYWNQYARGTMVGLTRGCTKEHFIRATLEAIAYQSYDVIHAMEEDSGVSLSMLKIDGGASANNLLCQFQTDISRITVFRPECVETTALGAAYLAGLAVGFYKDLDEIRSLPREGKTFTPQMKEEDAKELRKGWKRAVKCALCWAGDEEE